MLQRYRVNASVGELKYGELVDIDPTHEHWRAQIDAGYLRKVDSEEAPADRPARLATPDAVTERPDPTRVLTDDADVTQVRRALLAHPDETNAQIAERTGASRRLVGKVRRGEA